VVTGRTECVGEKDSILDAAKRLKQLDVGAMPICGEDGRLTVDEALHTMTEHKVRRLPVIDGRDLIGVVSQGDLAANLDDAKVGDLVEAISVG